jgi:MFS transporter, SHS family, lactate transporter
MELSPGAFRTFVVGTAYQLGNLASSASSTIEAQLGENYPLPPLVHNGKTTKRYEYGKVICIFMGAVYAYVILLTFIGPENRGKDLSVNADADAREVLHRQHPVGALAESGSGSDDDKAVRREKETV